MNEPRPETPTKSFATDEVLSVVTGRLVTERGIAAIYDVLNWMTGEDLFTHQLPRVFREARPVMLALYPELRRALDETADVTPENWREWRDRWIARYGETMAVPKLTRDEHEPIDPISELAEFVPPERIIVVKP